MTGTEGGSNLTFPVLAICKFSLVGVFTVSDLLPPLRPFHSASLDSGAVEFASESTGKKIMNEISMEFPFIFFSLFTFSFFHTQNINK